MDSISIFELQRALEPSLGLAGARQQILVALRSGEITGVCKSFVGMNPNSFSNSEYPEAAKGYRLPTGFWAPTSWSVDGEQTMSSRASDPWSTNTSWERGDFTISGSRRRGSIGIVQRAIGVTIARAEASSLLRKLGAPLTGGEDEMAAWAVHWMRVRLESREPYGERKMAQPFLERFPSANRKRIRAIHADAKRILNL